MTQNVMSKSPGFDAAEYLTFMYLITFSAVESRQIAHQWNSNQTFERPEKYSVWQDSESRTWLPHPNGQKSSSNSSELGLVGGGLEPVKIQCRRHKL